MKDEKIKILGEFIRQSFTAQRGYIEINECDESIEIYSIDHNGNHVREMFYPEIAGWALFLNLTTVMRIDATGYCFLYIF